MKVERDSFMKVEKEEIDEMGADVDVARERFESALLDLISKDEEISESDSDSSEHKLKIVPEPLSPRGVQNRNILRPVRKRRRKENDPKDGGFHHTFVMKMFDRSVDLAQFEESAPLYPICRAWMLNQPHNKELNSKKESMLSPQIIEEDSNPASEKNIHALPNPEQRQECHSWRNLQNFPVVGSDGLQQILEEPSIPPAVLLSGHLQKWKKVRNNWKEHTQLLDSRYMKSFEIFQTMFEKAHEG